jgi:hypothetical protein
MGYAFPPADPCSACFDNQLDLSVKCQAMIDCVGSMWPCSSNCWTQCLNSPSVQGSGVLDGCARRLATAACGPLP